MRSPDVYIIHKRIEGAFLINKVRSRTDFSQKNIQIVYAPVKLQMTCRLRAEFGRDFENDCLYCGYVYFLSSGHSGFGTSSTEEKQMWPLQFHSCENEGS